MPEPEFAAELEAITGPLKGSSIDLTELEVSIGREPSNKVSLLDASVSRRHCMILREGGQFKIQDLNSRNATFVNGVPVTERVLCLGRRDQDGQFHFRVRGAGSRTSQKHFDVGGIQQGRGGRTVDHRSTETGCPLPERAGEDSTHQ